MLGPGVALLGELDKVVSVSPSRFTAVVASSEGVHVRVTGRPGEQVSLTFAVGVGRAGATVKVVSLVMSSDGVASTFVSDG